MDYVVGGVAALISGNITPSRPKPLRRALTPTKHQPSPNVTPKSEFVDDRSIFMSPTLRKKKDVLKKSPKRIFQNPDLDVTNDGAGISALTSPKADKVKKHLKGELEGNVMPSTILLSPKSPKSNKNRQRKLSESVDVTPSKKKINKNILDSNEINDTTAKKKKKRDSTGTELFSDKENAVEESAESSKKSKKKRKLLSYNIDTGTVEPDKQEEVLSAKKVKKDKAEIPNEESTEKPNMVKKIKTSKAQKRRERKKKVKTKLIKKNLLAAPEKKLKDMDSPSKSKKNKKKLLTKTSINEETNEDPASDNLDTENILLDKKNKNRIKKNQAKEKSAHTSDAENESENEDGTRNKQIDETKKSKKHKLVKKQPINNQDSDSEDDNSKIEIESKKPNKNKKKNKSKPIKTEGSGDDSNLKKEEDSKQNRKKNKSKAVDTAEHTEIEKESVESKRNKKKNKSKPVANVNHLQLDSDHDSHSEKEESLELKANKKKNKSKPVANDSDHDSNSEKEQESLEPEPKQKKKKSKPVLNDSDQDSDSEKEESLELKPKKNKSKVNANAITDQNTDSEHESDNEIESENEQINEKILTTEQSQDNSSSEEEQEDKPQKKQSAADNSMADDPGVIKRTLFVGNVPFSKKCKKEIKGLFSKYGQIETIRIRTVPVKDGRVTPKMAVIKNELHPDRTTVNVYIKYQDKISVEKALAANNTVLNNHHLRVSRSDQSGAHDASHAVFVGNLPFALEDEGLRNVFEKCGEINSVRIVRDRVTNAGKGFGYVNFASRDGVELALSLAEEDLTIKNRILRVKRCSQNPKKEKHKGQGQQGNHGQGDNRKFQGNVQGRPQNNFQDRNQGGKFQDRNQGNRFQDRNQGNRFQDGNPRFQPRSQGGKFPQRNQNNNFERPQGGGFGRSDDGKGRSQGNRQRDGDGENKFEGAIRRLNKKRQNQEAADGPASKISKDDSSAVKEKKAKKEFVGFTADKKKKNKFDKGLKKKKILSQILMKKNVEA